MTLSSEADISLATDLLQTSCILTSAYSNSTEMENGEFPKLDGYKTLLLLFSDSVPDGINALDFDFVMPVALTENAELVELDRMKGRLDFSLFD